MGAIEFQHRRMGQEKISMQVYLSGKFFDKENAKISVFDHGFLFGDGVF